jgi:hypothetical protein
MGLPSKRIIISGAVALAIGVALSGTNGARKAGVSLFPFEGIAFGQARLATTADTSDKYFKNVTALKNMPVDEFMGEMGLFSAALSYCCGDCHVDAGTDHPDWASDKKPTKVIARRMATMVQQINMQNFGKANAGQVTCWTCHRGSPNPAKTPSMDIIYGSPLEFPEDVLKAAPSGSGSLTVDQIFQKFTTAMGGAAKIAALKSYVATGTSNLYEEVIKDKAEVYAKAPGQAAFIVHQRNGDVERDSDGMRAWIAIPETVLREWPLTGSLLEGAKLEAKMAFPGNLRTYLTNWKAALPTTIDGRGVYTLQGTGENGLVGTFYFDKQTGLLTRYIRYYTTTIGRVPTQIDYSDYRDVAGVKMPFKWTYDWISGREEYEMTNYQANANVDASKFTEPKH